MKAIIFNTIFFICLLPVAGFSQAKTPIDFNNAIVDIIDSLAKQGNQWTEQFTELNNTTKNFSELAKTRKQMIAYIDKQVQNLKQMKNVSGSEAFKQAAINYLLYEKKAIMQGFSVIEKLNDKSTPEEFQKAVNVLTDAAKDEPEMMEKFTNAQKAYAEKNNFTVQ